MDAVPVTFGQELGGWARAVRLGVERLEAVLPRLGELPLGGSATGTGLNVPKGFAAEVIARLAADLDLPLREATDHFEAQSQQDALVETSGAVKTVVALAAQDRRRPAADGLGTGGRAPRDRAARAAEGQLDHAGQGEPGDPRGRAAGVRPGGRQRRGDHVRGDDVDLPAQHGDAGDGPQPARVAAPRRQRRPAARRPVRRRPDRRRGDDAPLRRGLAGGGDRPQPVPRLRRGGSRLEACRRPSGARCGR